MHAIWHLSHKILASHVHTIKGPTANKLWWIMSLMVPETNVL